MALILLFAGLIAGLDQLSKLLVLQNIPLFGHVDVIPGFVGLTHTHNTGAAFSALEGQMWLFILIFLVITLAFLAELRHHKIGLGTFEVWCLAAIWGGGLGNFIDRLFRGFVVDMIRTEFMDFPVFNVADCFITCGCVLLLVHLVFFNKQFWKDGK